jgi:putative membrane protein
MKTQLLTGMALFAMLGPGVFAQNTANRLTPSDDTFATKAAEGGMAEVELGNLAQQRASSTAVKDFGKRMVTDHTKINDQLKSIAGKQGITLPTALDAKDQATMNRLSKLNGAAFDRAYMADMVKDHKGDIAEFQREANNGTNPELKSFAGMTLPTLQEHLRLAEDAQKQVK